MEWKSAFIVYRLDENGGLVEVFHADDHKKAKYWLTYIAEPGDVLCRTPAHPRFEVKSGPAEYVQHKLSSGKIAASFDEWIADARQKKFAGNFPQDQTVQPAR